MQQLFESDLALLTLTVALYCLGGALYRRTRLMILHPVLHPTSVETATGSRLPRSRSTCS